MAGQLRRIIESQKPHLHEYARQLLKRAVDQHGEDSAEYRGVYNQYFRVPEGLPGRAANTRHFEATMSGEYPFGLERLYRRVVVIDLLTACASECVFCVRGLYDRYTLSSSQVQNVCRYLAADPYLEEVLITGGDPLIAPVKLRELVDLIVMEAPNIRTVRIGTRLPVQNPLGMRQQAFKFFEDYNRQLLFEISIQVNHPFELQPETIDVVSMLQSMGVRLYSQNVLLKNVNDSRETLIELYDSLRRLRIIPYYLYHAVPLVGTLDRHPGPGSLIGG